MERFLKLLLLTLGLLAASMGLAQGIGGDPGLERALQAQAIHTDALLTRPGVIGTAVGRDSSNTPIMLVFLERAGTTSIPSRLENVDVQARVIGKIRAYRADPKFDAELPQPQTGEIDPRTRFDRPVPIGVSVGHPDVSAGTIGVQLFRIIGSGHAATINYYILSNNHVLANKNFASINDIIIQPGSFDGGFFPDDFIGWLSDFEQIVFSRRANNRFDAAIALVETTTSAWSTPENGYGTPRRSPVTASIGMSVMKYGRTTGQTGGTIDAINATVIVDYGPGPDARFTGQFVVSPGSFSAPGDSGSLIVVASGPDERKPVGLLFAGSDAHTIANPIDEILARFNVTISGDL